MRFWRGPLATLHDVIHVGRLPNTPADEHANVCT